MEEIQKVEMIADFINDETEMRCYQPAPNGGQNNEWYAEIEYYSPLGEDVVECVFFDGTAKSFIDDLVSLNEHYRERCEEDAKLNINTHTLRDLVDDADKKIKMFNEFTTSVVKHYNEVVANA